MSDTKRFDKEILSAWVDGKAGGEREQSLEQGSESMAVWARYHLIGQVMREETQHLDLDISASVSQAIAREENHALDIDQDLPKTNVIPFPSRVWKQAGGFAIAASVAIVALFSVSNTQPDATAVNTLASNATVETQNASNVIASNAGRQELQTMHDMFLKHEALTRKITGMSSLPTVRVVSNQKVIPVQVPMRMQEESQEQKAQSQAENQQDQ